jgi:hypothetical protein
MGDALRDLWRVPARDVLELGASRDHVLEVRDGAVVTGRHQARAVTYISEADERIQASIRREQRSHTKPIRLYPTHSTEHVSRAAQRHLGLLLPDLTTTRPRYRRRG